MSRLRRAVRATWAFLDRFGWVIAIVFVAISFHVIHNQGNALHRDEETHAREQAHTAAVQKAGEPTGVCLREGLKRSLPVAELFAHAVESGLPKTPPAERPIAELFLHLTRHAEAPLDAYVLLQGRRYTGATCPDSPIELARLRRAAER